MRATARPLLFLAFVAVVVATWCVATSGAACPNGCSGHGYCSGSTCYCDFGWLGEDCSYQDTLLTAGQTMSGTLATGRWAYAHISFGQSSTIIWTITQRLGSDCDIYINNGTFPTRSRWYQRDVSTKTNITIITPDAKPTKWYIGIYGFSSCTYHLLVNITHDCPNSCSRRGRCVNGECLCDPGYFGRDCSGAPVNLPINSTSPARSITTAEWVYYKITNLRSAAMLRFTLTQISNGDADLYFQINKLPGPFNFLFSNTSSNMVSWIDYAYYGVPNQHDLYLGVYGFRPTSYYLSVVATDLGRDFCVMGAKCSDHGSCQPGPSFNCRCDPRYNGTNCENMINPIPLEKTVSGYAPLSQWNYYHIEASTGLHELQITVKYSAFSACILYARDGAYPSITDYHLRVGWLSRNISATIPSIAESGRPWFIGILGSGACTYNLTVNELFPNNTACGPHGTPNDDGVCMCRHYYAGDRCQIPTTALEKGVALNGTVAKDQWAYYHIRTPSGNGTHMVQVHMAEIQSYVAGDLWLYASMVGWPTLWDYDKSDTRVGQRIHSLIYQSNTRPFVSQDVLIGVYGGPYAHDYNNFTIIAWYPDF